MRSIELRYHVLLKTTTNFSEEIFAFVCRDKINLNVNGRQWAYKDKILQP